MLYTIKNSLDTILTSQEVNTPQRAERYAAVVSRIKQCYYERILLIEEIYREKYWEIACPQLGITPFKSFPDCIAELFGEKKTSAYELAQMGRAHRYLLNNKLIRSRPPEMAELRGLVALREWRWDKLLEIAWPLYEDCSEQLLDRVPTLTMEAREALARIVMFSLELPIKYWKAGEIDNRSIQTKIKDWQQKAKEFRQNWDVEKFLDPINVLGSMEREYKGTEDDVDVAAQLSDVNRLHEENHSLIVERDILSNQNAQLQKELNQYKEAQASAIAPQSPPDNSSSQNNPSQSVTGAQVEILSLKDELEENSTELKHQLELVLPAIAKEQELIAEFNVWHKAEMHKLFKRYKRETARLKAKLATQAEEFEQQANQYINEKIIKPHQATLAAKNAEIARLTAQLEQFKLSASKQEIVSTKGDLVGAKAAVGKISYEYEEEYQFKAFTGGFPNYPVKSAPKLPEKVSVPEALPVEENSEYSTPQVNALTPSNLKTEGDTENLETVSLTPSIEQPVSDKEDLVATKLAELEAEKAEMEQFFKELEEDKSQRETVATKDNNSETSRKLQLLVEATSKPEPPKEEPKYEIKDDPNQFLIYCYESWMRSSCYPHWSDVVHKDLELLGQEVYACSKERAELWLDAFRNISSPLGREMPILKLRWDEMVEQQERLNNIYYQ